MLNQPQTFPLPYHDMILYIVTAVGVSHNNCTDGDIRLAGGTVSNEGRVEICVSRVWGTVCHGSTYFSNYWDIYDATVVCRQLGHQQLGMYNVHAARCAQAMQRL